MKHIHEIDTDTPRRMTMTNSRSHGKVFPHVTQPITGTLHTGRNDLCLCGSGKKFKHCHLPKIERRQAANRRTVA